MSKKTKRQMDPRHLRGGKHVVRVEIEADEALAFAVAEALTESDESAREALERIVRGAALREVEKLGVKGAQGLREAEVRKEQVRRDAAESARQKRIALHLKKLRELGADVSALEASIAGPPTIGTISGMALVGECEPDPDLGSIAGPQIPGAGQEMDALSRQHWKEKKGGGTFALPIGNPDEKVVNVAPDGTITEVEDDEPPPSEMIDPDTLCTTCGGLGWLAGPDPQVPQNGQTRCPDCSGTRRRISEPDPHEEAGTG